MEAERDAPDPVATVEASEADSVEPSAAVPVQVAPWSVRLLVVDEVGQPVPGANVMLWAAVHSGPPPPTRRTEPLLQQQSDANGCAETTVVESLVFAAAGMHGMGDSEEVPVSPTAAGERRKLVLERPRAIRGRVLRTDGLPAAGARVVAYVVSSSRRHHVSPPAAVQADERGAFAIPVRSRVGYEVFAELGEARSFSENVWVDFDESHEVVLVFPGAIVVRGFVVDERGAAVAGARVKAWCENDGVGRAEREPVDTRTRDDGAFELSVKRHARYQLVANAAGHANNVPVQVTPSIERPVIDTVLHLQAMSTIRGRVVETDRTPIVGAGVHAHPETGGVPSFPWLSREDRFGPSGVTTTAADGTFVLAVHPDPTYRIVVSLVGAVSVRRHGILPGTRDLEIRCTAGERAGCVVHGRVTRVDGEPCGQVRVTFLADEGIREGYSRQLSVRAVDDGFVTPPLPFGMQVSLRVELAGRFDQQDLAPAFVGPFTTDRAEIVLPCRLEAWAEVPVRVVDDGGLGLRDVTVHLRPLLPSRTFSAPQLVDSNGCVVLARQVPGPSQLVVYSGQGEIHRQEITVTPGLNAEVVVRLPAPASAR